LVFRGLQMDGADVAGAAGVFKRGNPSAGSDHYQRSPRGPMRLSMGASACARLSSALLST
jgi:hypothetical protein